MAYVYPPVSGEISALDYYCNMQYCYKTSVPHPAAYCSTDPAGRIDIATSPVYQDLGFWGSSDIGYVYVQGVPGTVCGNSSVPPPWNFGMSVDLYLQNNAYLGRVFYAHVANPGNTGWYWYPYIYPGGIYLGTVPGCCEQACDGSGCYGCYQGPHSHIERCNGGITNSFSCCASVGAGSASSWLFQF